jgi:hypothetical protein
MNDDMYSICIRTLRYSTILQTLFELGWPCQVEMAIGFEVANGHFNLLWPPQLRQCVEYSSIAQYTHIHVLPLSKHMLKSPQPLAHAYTPCQSYKLLHALLILHTLTHAYTLLHTLSILHTLTHSYTRLHTLTHPYTPLHK